MEKDYFMNSWNGLNTNIDQSFFDPSPAVSTSALSNDAFALLGKLGGGGAPHPHDNNNDSSYTTNTNNLNFPILDTDPGFAERAAKFSCFGSRSFNGRNGGGVEIPHGSAASPLKMLPRVSSSPSLKKKNFRQEVDCLGFPNKSSKLSGGSRSGSGANSSNDEESTVSEQILSGEINIVSRKRKQGSRVKTTKQDHGSHLPKEIGRGGDDGNTMKRTKNEKTEGGGDKEKAAETETEPLKDYIHVRARRGQATDSHSLAERVRREKIGERMKLLQDLVPGCNKVTGKALMLDEIINYVQSLQRQVEFLSMKLASVNPELDSNINNLLTKDVFQQNASIPQQMFPLDYNHLSHQNVQQLQLPSINIDGFTQNFSQFQGFNEDDLHSIVQMGFGQNPLHFHETSNMKVER